MSKKELILSNLKHTWFIDIDGTIFKHNGYKNDGYDTILPGAKEFLNSISKDDFIILVTSRTNEFKEITLKSLRDNGIKFNDIIFNCPYGERIIINDDKPGGLKCCIAINIKRDTFPKIEIKTSEEL